MKVIIKLRKKKLTWHCKIYKKIKNLPKDLNKFCNFVIQVKHCEDNKNFLFQEKEENNIGDENDFNINWENYIKSNKKFKVDFQRFIKYEIII